MSDEREPFMVSAGKFEDIDPEEYLKTGEPLSKNYKYCDSFKTLDEAMNAAKACFGYHFIEIEFTDKNGRTYEVQLEEK
jgi:hypothetical protein